MNQSQQIHEDFRGSKKSGVFLNPDFQEWKTVNRDANAIATIDGNLFITSEKGIDSLHTKFSLLAQELYPDVDLKYAMTEYGNNRFQVHIQRVGITNTFAMAESELFVLDVEPSRMKRIKTILKNTRKNNPRVKFVLVDITKVEETMNQSEAIIYDLSTMTWQDGETQPIDEPASVIRSFAFKSGKKLSSVENLWKKLIAQGEKRGFKDDRLFTFVVGTLKKILKIDTLFRGKDNGSS